MGGKKKPKRKVVQKMTMLKTAIDNGDIKSAGKLNIANENLNTITDGMTATLKNMGYAPVVIIGMNKEGQMANIVAPMVTPKDAIALLEDALNFEKSKIAPAKIIPIGKGGRA